MSRPQRGRGDRTERPAWTPGSPDTEESGSPAGFLCAHCGAFVPEPAFGTGQRNHCPHCLWSLHVDIKPGDRRSLCTAAMEPIAIWVAQSDEWRLIHRCSGCGVLKPNRIAGDDSEGAIGALADRLRGTTPPADDDEQWL